MGIKYSKEQAVQTDPVEQCKPFNLEGPLVPFDADVNEMLIDSPDHKMRELCGYLYINQEKMPLIGNDMKCVVKHTTSIYFPNEQRIIIYYYDGDKMICCICKVYSKMAENVNVDNYHKYEPTNEMIKYCPSGLIENSTGSIESGNGGRCIQIEKTKYRDEIIFRRREEMNKQCKYHFEIINGKCVGIIMHNPKITNISLEKIISDMIPTKEIKLWLFSVSDVNKTGKFRISYDYHIGDEIKLQIYKKYADVNYSLMFIVDNNCKIDNSCGLNIDTMVFRNVSSINIVKHECIFIVYLICDDGNLICDDDDSICDDDILIH